MRARYFSVLLVPAFVAPASAQIPSADYDLSSDMRQPLAMLQKAAAAKDRNGILFGLEAAMKVATTADDRFVAAIIALKGAPDGRTQIVALEAAMQSGSPYARVKAPQFHSALSQLYRTMGQEDKALQAEQRAELAAGETDAAKVALNQHRQRLAAVEQVRRQEQAAAEKAKQKQGGGGLFGKMLKGALAGAQGMANGGYGMSEAIAGAGIGAIAGAADVDAQTISSATTTAMSGSSGSFASVSGVSQSGSGYAARPNALAGSAACSGFSEGNYQQMALSNGMDEQLRVMCGQAYDLYASYKRAIAQGYSEADANRTYDAHQKAALVATSFYQNNPAN